MALDQTTKDTILSRFQGGEVLPAVFKDLSVSIVDQKAYYAEYADQIKAERLKRGRAASNQQKTVEQLDAGIADLTEKLAEVQAEKDSR